MPTLPGRFLECCGGALVFAISGSCSMVNARCKEVADPDRSAQKKEAWWPALEVNWSVGREGRPVQPVSSSYESTKG